MRIRKFRVIMNLRSNAHYKWYTSWWRAHPAYKRGFNMFIFFILFFVRINSSMYTLIEKKKTKKYWKREKAEKAAETDGKNNLAAQNLLILFFFFVNCCSFIQWYILPCGNCIFMTDTDSFNVVFLLFVFFNKQSGSCVQVLYQLNVHGCMSVNKNRLYLFIYTDTGYV